MNLVGGHASVLTGGEILSGIGNVDQMMRHASLLGGGNLGGCDVDSSIDLISKAIQDLSDISKSLNSELIKNDGFYNTLKNETEKICRSGKYTIEFTEDGNIVFLSAHKELILYRIAQEALNNILKHACADFIWIKLRYEPSHIGLLIKDNGKGFDKHEIEKYRSGKINNGLINMRTRTMMLGGTLIIESEPDKGTSVFITAPYQ